MKYVLQVFSSLDKGGAESRTMDLYRRLDKTKVQFNFAVTTPGEGFYMPEIRDLGGKIIVIQSWREIGLRRWLMQWKAALKGTDVVHCHIGFDSGLILFIAWLFGTPKRISHARGMHPEPGRFHRWKERLLRMMIRCFSTDLIGCSHEAGAYVFGKKCMETRGIFLPNAIEIERYQVEDGFDRFAWRQALGIPADSFVLGSVGNLRAVKNQRFMIDILQALRRIQPKAVLLIAGEGDMRQSLSEYAAELGLAECVFLPGQRHDIPELLAAIDVFLLTSFSEGLPGSAVEAQSAGVHCALASTITKEADAGAGLVAFLPLEESPETWAACIQELSSRSKPDLKTVHAQMKANNFDVQDSLQRLLSIYFPT